MFNGFSEMQLQVDVLETWVERKEMLSRLPATVNLSPGLLPNSFSGNFGLGYVDCLAHSLFSNAMRLTFDCRFKLYNSDEETTLPLLGTLDLPPGTEIWFLDLALWSELSDIITDHVLVLPTWLGTLQKKHWVGIDNDLPYKENEDSRTRTLLDNAHRWIKVKPSKGREGDTWRTLIGEADLGKCCRAPFVGKDSVCMISRYHKRATEF
ncbi:hypothetical protein Patl1_15080 [Pistacia atlantica]|uniref:Uncharacterized protein n=1 Tax=Pistacia atlantica TaxID=434234 RepID=A0ACC1B7E8_9ROSI|nr:hypothetical protein Patl1_15080 [Pistacia atlantica]